MQTVEQKREEAARWYDREAAATSNSAIARRFPAFAERIRRGDADHRLDDILIDQREAAAMAEHERANPPESFARYGIEA